VAAEAAAVAAKKDGRAQAAGEWCGCICWAQEARHVALLLTLGPNTERRYREFWSALGPCSHAAWLALDVLGSGVWSLGRL
jgi:hypothetical protein